MAKTRVKSKASRKAKAPPQTSDRRIYLGLGLLVTGLFALAWWSIPGSYPVGTTDEEAGATADPEETTKTALGVVERPGASLELSIVTSKATEVVREAATVTEIGKRLDVRHCGGACDAVRKFMAGEDAFTIELRPAEDLILPPPDTFDTVAPGLTSSERESVPERKNAVILHAQGKFDPAHLPARAALAATAVLAEALDGLVWDEAERKLETAADFGGRTIRTPLGEPAFARNQIVVQLYRQEDGTARLLTLGMGRFGSPDLSLHGANMASGPLLAEVLNAAAAKMSHGGALGPEVTIALEDVARVVGKKPGELNANPGNARSVVLDVAEPERQEGDPDNALGALVPKDGPTREAWDTVFASLFGVPPSVTAPVDDKELTDIANKARRDLPEAIKRQQRGDGELFVKGPFAIPEEARVEGGAPTELLWIAVASCDAKACTGTLANDPTYATNLAAGKTTSVQRTQVADWAIHQRDGGTIGGESIRLLKARVPK